METCQECCAVLFPGNEAGKRLAPFDASGPKHGKSSAGAAELLIRTVAVSSEGTTVAVVAEGSSEVAIFSLGTSGGSSGGGGAAADTLELVQTLDAGASIDSVAFAATGTLWLLCGGNATAPIVAFARGGAGTKQGGFSAVDVAPALSHSVGEMQASATSSGMVKLKDLVKLTEGGDPDPYHERKLARLSGQEAKRKAPATTEAEDAEDVAAVTKGQVLKRNRNKRPKGDDATPVADEQ
jgi:hypothetical protein